MRVGSIPEDNFLAVYGSLPTIISEVKIVSNVTIIFLPHDYKICLVIIDVVSNKGNFFGIAFSTGNSTEVLKMNSVLCDSVEKQVSSLADHYHVIEEVALRIRPLM